MVGKLVMETWSIRGFITFNNLNSPIFPRMKWLAKKACSRTHLKKTFAVDSNSSTKTSFSCHQVALCGVAFVPFHGSYTVPKVSCCCCRGGNGRK